MSDLEKAARLALEFCEFCWRDVPMNDYAFERLEKIITALREQLAPCRYADMCNEEGECTDGCAALRQALSDSVEQPAQQKPVGYVYSVYGERIKNACIESDVPNGAPVYILPQRKPWAGLTDEERKRAIQFNNAHEALAVVIEAKLKEKNNGTR